MNIAADPPREEIEFDFRSASARGLWSGFYLTTVLAAMLAGVFGLVVLALLLSGMDGAGAAPGKPLGPARFVLTEALAIAYFFGLAWLFLAVVGFPLGLFSAIRNRRFAVYVDGENLVYETRFRDFRVPVAQCRWRVMNMGTDSWGAYWPRQPVVRVKMSDRDWIVCGFDATARERWVKFLTETGAEQEKTPRVFRWIMISLGSLSAGGVIGSVAGAILVSLTGNEVWGFTAIFLGLFDGLAIPLAWAWLSRGEPGRDGKAFTAVVTAIIFATFALSAVKGFSPSVFCTAAAVNAAIGWTTAMIVLSVASNGLPKSSARD